MDEEMPLSLPDTQNVDEVPFIQSQEVTSNYSQIWGRLFPISPRLKQLVMTKDIYSVGRLNNCDVCLSRNELDEKELLVVSKVHFRISREFFTGNSGDCVISLEDLSSNGTFINKKLVGRGKKVILRNNDAISLAKPSMEVYTYVSSSSFESDGLPIELQEKYVVSRVLGSGACGEVKLILGIFNNKRFALKTISKRNTGNAGTATLDNKRIRTEVDILRSLTHPCIIKMIEIVETPSKMFIVLEMMEGGELFDRITKTDGLIEPVAKHIFYQIVQAVYYLHNKGITHRDLKPENILLASNNEYPLVKVTDFGLSKFVDEATLMQTFCGTPMYVAPEILITNGRASYTKQVDVWSLGVILYVSITGRTPFTSHHRMPLRDQIIRGAVQFPPALFGRISIDAIDLIKRMMTVHPSKRITLRSVIQHVWLEDRKMRRDVNILMGSNEENHAPLGQGNRLNHLFEEQAPLAKRMRRF